MENHRLQLCQPFLSKIKCSSCHSPLLLHENCHQIDKCKQAETEFKQLGGDAVRGLPIVEDMKSLETDGVKVPLLKVRSLDSLLFDK